MLLLSRQYIPFPGPSRMFMAHLHRWALAFLGSGFLRSPRLGHVSAANYDDPTSRRFPSGGYSRGAGGRSEERRPGVFPEQVRPPDVGGQHVDALVPGHFNHLQHR